MIIHGTEYESPILPLEGFSYNGVELSGENRFYIKRDDLIPFSFGGNKARMALAYFDEAARLGAGSIITYGGSSSNMCRIVANMAAARGLPCYIVTPDEFREDTFNSRLSGELLGAELVRTDVVHSFGVIRKLREELTEQGRNPYFIESGGHGVIGTEACLGCYEEIRAYEQRRGIHFDYIFLTVGTGTTQSGLLLGQLLHRDERHIVGISTAQKNPRGRGVLMRSVAEALKVRGMEADKARIEAVTDLADAYIGEGYGKSDDDTGRVIDAVFTRCGIPLDAVYTGKGFRGMLCEVAARGIRGCHILFIHTGGTPLFFDWVQSR